MGRRWLTHVNGGRRVPDGDTPNWWRVAVLADAIATVLLDGLRHGLHCTAATRS